MIRNKKIRLVGIGIIGLAALGVSPPAKSHSCYGKTHYEAVGRLSVALSDNFSDKSGIDVADLEGVEVRLRRPGVSGAGGSGPSSRTNSEGRFVVHGCFPRDSNGILRGGDDIRIALQARFKSNKLKVRDANGVDPNWHRVMEYSAQGGGRSSLGRIIYNNGTINRAKFNEQAELWWLYWREIKRLEDEGVSLINRVTVTYPHLGVVQRSTQSYAVTQIFLGSPARPSNRREPSTMIHELMHIWHGQNLRGNAALGCIFDGHHKAPDKWNSARCSGFMEGIAEAAAKRIMFTHYNNDDNRTEPLPISTADLNAGNGNYRLTTLDDAEKTDIGWENFFRYLFSSDEWAPNGLTASPSCNARDVSLFELLNVLQATNFSVSQPRFHDVLTLLEEQIPDFTSEDTAIYLALTNPANDPAEAHETFCQEDDQRRFGPIWMGRPWRRP